MMRTGKTLRKIIAKAEDLEVRRNQIIHSRWGVGDNALSITRFKMTAKQARGNQFQVETITDRQLADFAKKIKILAQEVIELQFELIRAGKATSG